MGHQGHERPLVGDLRPLVRWISHLRSHHPEEVSGRIATGMKLRREEGLMKTLAIRLEDDLHAKLTILAKLSNTTVTEAIRTAIEAHLSRLAADKDISARAEAVLTEIDREASEQRAAIANLFGDGKTATPPPARGSSRAKS